MEGLDFVTLYVALTPSQAEAVLNGLGAMPEESSNRFGLRTSKMAASIFMNGNIGMVLARLLV